jgi:UDP-N-acetylmuramoyl-L-alanyl-D-glutamate--2,6-diaminopimelate ligase
LGHVAPVVSVFDLLRELEQGDAFSTDTMKLSSLAPDFPRAGGPGDPEITAVTEDSRRVEPGALFVAVTGTAADGHDFIPDALARGAAAVAVEQRAAPSTVPAIVVPSSRDALAVLAARFHRHPARDLTIVGFTGTFGKTSTSEILRALLEAAGFEPAVIGSLGARYRSFTERGAGLTTPAAPDLHAALARLRDAGARQVVMEVTTHALRLRRVHGVRFRGGLIAAIMPGEHTDYHRTYEDYVEAKRLFLEYLAPDALLAYDADNRAARTLAREAQVARTAGLTLRDDVEMGPDDLVVTDVALDGRGARFTARGAQVRNAGLALAYALAAGVSIDTARDVLASLTPLRRRMERFDVGGRAVLDDTAGHPDSLGGAFEAASFLPHGRLWVGYAIRGNRGADINRRNALALARLASLYGAAGVVMTASNDAAGPQDRATAEEIDASRAVVRERGGRASWHDDLDEAMKELAARSRPGDLVLLVGAQSMDCGRDYLIKYCSANTAHAESM